MEVIYINDNYPLQVLAWYQKNGIQRPVLNKIYSIRDLIKSSVFEKTGVLLNEVVNPKIGITHPILGRVFMEPNFNIERFTDLQGNKLTKEEIQKILVDNKQKQAI